MDNQGNYRKFVIERWVSSNLDTFREPDEEVFAIQLGFTFFFSCLTSVSLWYYTALNKTHVNLISSLIGSCSYITVSYTHLTLPTTPYV